MIFLSKFIQKPKQTFKQKTTLDWRYFFLFSAFTLAIGIGLFSYGPQAKAAKYGSGDIEFELSVSDNFFRIQKDKPVTMKATLKLLKPDQLKIDSLSGDEIDISNGSNLAGINVGVVKVEDKDQKCQSVGSLFPVSSWNKAVHCEFFYKSSSKQQLIKKGDTLEFDMLIPAGARNSAGMNVASDAGVLNKMYVYPFFELNRIVGFSWQNVTFTDAKEVTLEIYNTDAQVLANASKPRPVAGNGSVTTKTNVEAGRGMIGLINDIITGITQFIISFLYTVVYKLLLPIIIAALSIKTYSDSFVNVIYVGWQILRNVSNIFFIVALIVIGLATLLRSKGYEYKHLLVELIMAALLVNFSLVVGQSILAIADTAQAQFLPTAKNGDVLKNLGLKLMPNDVKQKIDASPFVSDSFFSTAITNVFMMMMAVGAFGVFAALTVFLFIRIVAIWLLLMVSPLAFAANVLPSTHHFSSEWWGNFIKYASFTPIMAFFLNIAALVADNSGNILKSVNPTMQGNWAGDLAITIVYSVGGNMILIIFLYAALKVAEDFGIFGAHAIVDIAKKGMFAPAKVAFGTPAYLAKAGVETGAEWAMTKKTQISTRWPKQGLFGSQALGKVAFAALNPKAISHAFKTRREDREHKIEHLATGEAENIVHSLPGFSEETPDAREHAFVHGVAEYAKELPYISEKATFNILAKMMKEGEKDEIGRMKIWGQIKNLAEEKGMNYTLLNAEKLGMDHNYSASAEGFVQFMNDVQKKGFATKDEAGHMAAELGKISYKNREYWYSEMFKVHGTHQSTIDVDDKGNVIGEAKYKKVMAGIDSKTEKKMNEWKADKAAAKETYTDVEERAARQAIRQKVESDEMEHMEHDEEFGNYHTFVEGQNEAYTNYTKMAPQAKAREAHWSTEVEVKPDGKYTMSTLGIAHIVTADAGDFGQGNQLQLKKKRAFQQAFKQDEVNIRKKVFEKVRDDLIKERKEEGYEMNAAELAEVEDKAQKLATFKVDAFSQYYADGDEFKKTTKDAMKKKLVADIPSFAALDPTLQSEIADHL